MQVLALSFAASIAVAAGPSAAPSDDPDVPVFPPVPPTSSTPHDDSFYQLVPVPQYAGRLGAGNFGDAGHTSGTMVADLLLFLEAGSLSLLVQGEIAGVPGSAFDYVEGSVRARVRRPLSPGQLVWWGLGSDIRGRKSDTRTLDGYTTVELPVGLIGVMHAIGNECVVYFFAKAAAGIVDTQSMGRAKLDRYLRPAVGAEGFFQCAGVRMFVDYEHVTKINSFTASPTDRASFETSKTWQVWRRMQVGGFVKGDIVREATPESDRLLRRLLGGVEARY